MQEECASCHEPGEEEAMIYAVANDEYLCNQDCLDDFRELIDGN